MGGKLRVFLLLCLCVDGLCVDVQLANHIGMSSAEQLDQQPLAPVYADALYAAVSKMPAVTRMADLVAAEGFQRWFGSVFSRVQESPGLNKLMSITTPHVKQFLLQVGVPKTTTALLEVESKVEAESEGSLVCAKGYYKTSTGDWMQQHSCVTCPIGYYTSVDDAEQCTLCPGGYYNSGVGLSSCSECRTACDDPTGERMVSNCHASTDIECECLAGYGGMASTRTSNCYNDDVTFAAQVAAQGWGGASTCAGHSSSECELGTDLAVGLQTYCPQLCGTTGDNDVQAVATYGVACSFLSNICGTDVNARTMCPCTCKCTACAAGKYTVMSGLQTCTDCPNQYYQSATGQTRCYGCPTETYAPVGTTGAATCSACSPACDGVTEFETIPCTVGTDRQCSACFTTCTAGFYVNPAALCSLYTCEVCSSSCPVGQYISQPCTGTTQSDIVCSACRTSCGVGYRLSEAECDGTATTDRQCIPCTHTACPAGHQLTRCDGSTTSDNSNCSPCPEGFFQPFEQQTSCIACTECLNGKIQSRHCGSTHDRECACPKGWDESYDGKSCSNPGVTKQCGSYPVSYLITLAAPEKDASHSTSQIMQLSGSWRGTEKTLASGQQNGGALDLVFVIDLGSSREICHLDIVNGDSADVSTGSSSWEYVVDEYAIFLSDNYTQHEDMALVKYGVLERDFRSLQRVEMNDAQGRFLKFQATKYGSKSAGLQLLNVHVREHPDALSSDVVAWVGIGVAMFSLIIYGLFFGGLVAIKEIDTYQELKEVQQQRRKKGQHVLTSKPLIEDGVKAKLKKFKNTALMSSLLAVFFGFIATYATITSQRKMVFSILSLLSGIVSLFTTAVSANFSWRRLSDDLEQTVGMLAYAPELAVLAVMHPNLGIDEVINHPPRMVKFAKANTKVFLQLLALIPDYKAVFNNVADMQALGIQPDSPDTSGVMEDAMGLLRGSWVESTSDDDLRAMSNEQIAQKFGFELDSATKAMLPPNMNFAEMIIGMRNNANAASSRPHASLALPDDHEMSSVPRHMDPRVAHLPPPIDSSLLPPLPLVPGVVATLSPDVREAIVSHIENPSRPIPPEILSQLEPEQLDLLHAFQRGEFSIPPTILAELHHSRTVSEEDTPLVLSASLPSNVPRGGHVPLVSAPLEIDEFHVSSDMLDSLSPELRSALANHLSHPEDPIPPHILAQLDDDQLYMLLDAMRAGEFELPPEILAQLGVPPRVPPRGELDIDTPRVPRSSLSSRDRALG